LHKYVNGRLVDRQKTKKWTMASGAKGRAFESRIAHTLLSFL
jgi:hypothetical protein